MKTGTYANPEKVGGWLGWAMPDDESWIVFIATDGTPVRFDMPVGDGPATPPNWGEVAARP